MLYVYNTIDKERGREGNRARGGETGEKESTLKVHNVFPKDTFPPWLHPV